MREELKKLEERGAMAVELARKSGVDGVFAWANMSRSSSLSMRNGDVEALEEKRSHSLSLQLYVKGRYFTSSTNDLRNRELERFVGEAAALAKLIEADPFRELPPPDLFVGRSSVDIDVIDDSIFSRTPDDRISVCKALSEQTAGTPQLISANANTSDGFYGYAGVSSNGFVGSRGSTWISASSSLILRDQGDMRAEGGMWASMAHRPDMPTIEWIASEAVQRAQARLGAKKGPTTKTTMVVDRRAMGRLIWSLLGPAFGSSVQQKRSFWSDRLGKPAVSPRFELTDHPLLPRRMGSRLFDSEGIASKVRPVFAGGALTMFFLDTYHAKKLGAEATTGAPSNIVVKLGTGDLESIVSDVGKGIYVTEWNGGNSDSTTGKFSFGASGHVIENGRIGAPVKEMNVTGDLLELFARVVAVGADPWPYGNTSSPTIAFEGVSFSGA